MNNMFQFVAYAHNVLNWYWLLWWFLPTFNSVGDYRFCVFWWESLALDFEPRTVYPGDGVTIADCVGERSSGDPALCSARAGVFDDFVLVGLSTHSWESQLFTSQRASRICVLCSIFGSWVVHCALQRMDVSRTLQTNVIGGIAMMALTVKCTLSPYGLLCLSWIWFQVCSVRFHLSRSFLFPHTNYLFLF